MGLAGGALIAQWHRRVSIGTRLRSFAVVCAAIVPLALAFVLLPISLAFTLGMVLVYAGITGALITLKTIDFPWPIPLARIWRGEIGLAKTYWVWIMLVGTSILWTMMLISQLLYEFTGALFIVALKMAFSLIFSVVLVVSVWRSARNYEGPWRWRVLARVACVLSGVLAVVNLGGLLGEVPFFKAVAIGDQNTANEMMRSFFGIKSR